MSNLPPSPAGGKPKVTPVRAATWLAVAGFSVALTVMGMVGIAAKA